MRYHAQDHAVHALFQSYGLHGIMTPKQYLALLDGRIAQEVHDAAQRHTTYQGKPLTLYVGGTVAFTTDIPGFDSFNEVMELIGVMIGQADGRSMVENFYSLQTHFEGQSIVRGRPLVVDYDLSQEEGWTAVARETRRGHIRFDKITLGPNFVWEQFTRLFTTY